MEKSSLRLRLRSSRVLAVYHARDLPCSPSIVVQKKIRDFSQSTTSWISNKKPCAQANVLQAALGVLLQHSNWANFALHACLPILGRCSFSMIPIKKEKANLHIEMSQQVREYSRSIYSVKDAKLDK